MSVIELERDHHPAGEYDFTPSALTLSFGLASIALEQVSDGQPWAGTTVRGDIQVMPAGNRRSFRHRSACTFECITLPSECADLRPQLGLRDPPLRHVLEALVAAAAAEPTTRLFEAAIAQAVVARLRQLDGAVVASSHHGLPPMPLARVLAYLEAHLADDVSVSDLAGVAGLSPAHFSTMFRTSVGEAPHRHLVRLRVERARQLLERGVDPASAARATGFYDQSHLARHTARLLGVSPGRIARSAKDRPGARRNVRDPR